MITFRSIEEKDLEIIKYWRNSPGVLPYVREYRLLSDYDQDKWFEAYQKQRRTSDWDQELMLILDEDLSIGVGGFVRTQWRNRRAELSFFIGEDAARTKDIIKDSLESLIDLGFNTYGFNKITWPVYGHDPNLDIYKDILKEEAVLKEEYFWNGKFYDRHYLSILAKDLKK